MKSLKENRKNTNKNSEEHILPLINVVFLLLIFFMIAGQLTTADPFKITPSTSISEREVDNDNAIIHMDQDGNLAFQNKPASLDQLEAQVADYLKATPKGILRLKVDGDQNAGKVLSLMMRLRGLGVEKVTLVTLREAP